MARIRTIKPEFWQNETLAGISEHARLLAIALLNHSDDRGYFFANVSLVRAACFPFEEHSRNVLGSLQDLSRIGYIEVRECDGKAIGRVCKFLDHQRIDKPQKSKLESIFAAFPKEIVDSKNIPGTFQESSESLPRLEQGTGNREQGNGTGEQGTGEQGNGTVNLSDKIGRSEKSYPVPFEEFWTAFPPRRRTKKGDAYRSWKAATKLAATDTLTRMAAQYAASDKGSGQFAVMPSVWLNSKMWEDDPAAWDEVQQQQANTPVTFAQQRQLNTKKVIENFINEHSGNN